MQTTENPNLWGQMTRDIIRYGRFIDGEKVLQEIEKILQLPPENKDSVRLIWLMKLRLLLIEALAMVSPDTLSEWPMPPDPAYYSHCIYGPEALRFIGYIIKNPDDIVHLNSKEIDVIRLLMEEMADRSNVSDLRARSEKPPRGIRRTQRAPKNASFISRTAYLLQLSSIFPRNHSGQSGVPPRMVVS